MGSAEIERELIPRAPAEKAGDRSYWYVAPGSEDETGTAAGPSSIKPGISTLCTDPKEIEARGDDRSTGDDAEVSPGISSCPDEIESLNTKCPDSGVPKGGAEPDGKPISTAKIPDSRNSAASDGATDTGDDETWDRAFRGRLGVR
jgi:hypothetical protein